LLDDVGIINACVNSYVPLYKRAAGSKKSPWISKETKKLLKKLDRAWLAYKRNTKLFAYNKVRNKTVTSIRNDKVQYQKKLVKRMKNSQKMFYSYIRSKQKNPKTVSKVCSAAGKISENDRETA